eukprot:TRINITY_DN48319_c0_g1_i1.p1 TRINITY_DN48319_c0_g1~~TRINITY_DN48319_c0_g1_i1.p1  ORF type:complete len:895 (-),score=110.01 TRINITY_DN48319_c0_g1_i1:89-2731(-)
MAFARAIGRFTFRGMFVIPLMFVQLFAVVWALWAAYDIRMYPIKDFGHTIHEFDPWFNYRATEYLAENGISKFNKWYDYMSWYPIGRPIGTTIYPGMQITAVAIWEGMKKVPPTTLRMPKLIRGRLSKILKRLRDKGMMWVPPLTQKIVYVPMSINEICCMIPPWFGSLATVFLGLLAYEITQSVNVGVFSAGVFSILPAHLMRSIGGKFDNEAVAMAAICSTFWLWNRSVRTPSSWLWGIFSGISYVYMVAAWGGYIFVLNMIGMHALMLVCLGRFNSGVYKAYTLFYVIGTVGAIQIPVIGWTPVRSLEQMGPLGVFLGFQALAFSDWQRRRQNLKTSQFVFLRIKVLGLLLAAIAVAVILLLPTGYFGPLSSRIRGLFVKHTKTGNPLVDSVAEHQPANSGMYTNYLNLPLDYAWFGGAVLLLNRTNGAYFVLLYALIAMHFSGKMSRLVLICGPICSIGCGLAFGWLTDFLLEPFLLLLGKKGYTAPVETVESKPSATSSNKPNGKESTQAKEEKTKQSKVEDWPLCPWDEDYRPGGIAHIKRSIKRRLWNVVPASAQRRTYTFREKFDSSVFMLISRAVFSIACVVVICRMESQINAWATFARHCDSVAKGMSNAKVKFNVRQQDGSNFLVDDYWQGYKWIAKNTPKDSRVMAWWDYGYQITGIAERTSIADGNTWNHEHIATLGRILTSSQKKAHNSIRHLADYVLVWAGGRGDDLAKSPHLARIGNSVFTDHCGDDDPKCTKFGFNGGVSKPTPMMKESLLYNLVQHGLPQGGGAKARPTLFKEVHTTKHGLMRVFQVLNVSQESKAWIADPANRICDAPGSWYCVGQYPPALDKLIRKRKSFSQLEDFNKVGEKSAYTKLIEKEMSKTKKEL